MQNIQRVIPIKQSQEYTNNCSCLNIKKVNKNNNTDNRFQSYRH